MPLLLIIGGVLILAGLALLVAWFPELLIVVKALVPLGIIGLGGLLAYFGWEERRERKGAFLDFSSPDEADRYQADALAYQRKLDDLADSFQALDSDPAARPALESPPGPATDPPEALPEIAESAENSEISGLPDSGDGGPPSDDGGAETERAAESGAPDGSAPDAAPIAGPDIAGPSLDKTEPGGSPPDEQPPEQTPERQPQAAPSDDPAPAAPADEKPHVIIESAPDDQQAATVTVTVPPSDG